MNTNWDRDWDESNSDHKIWAFDYQTRQYPKGPYERKQITDTAHNIFVRRVKFLKWSQEPDQLNYVGRISMPYCVPGQKTTNLYVQ
jgi:hypothetical protein